MSAKRIATVLTVCLLAGIVLRAAETKPTVESIGDNLVCLCGCVALLNHCPHQNCSTHDEVKAHIQTAISQGENEPEILQGMVERYGVKILAAPPAKGFNLAAWILPGIGLIGGLAVVVVIVRRLRRARGVPLSDASVDPKLLAAVEEEMKTTGMEVKN